VVRHPDPAVTTRNTGRRGAPPIRRALRLTIAVLVVVLAAATLRVTFYRQTDDAERVAAKRAYLEEVRRVAASAPDRPNVVFILFDDLGVGDLGVYGGGAIDTPSLDRLADEGMVFRDAYAPAPYCSASRVGWLTGRYAVRSGLDHVVQAPYTWQDILIRLGGLNRRLPFEEIVLAEVLQAAGYSTAVVGKWHLGDESPSLPNDMGFDRFYGLLYSNDQGEPEVWADREIVERHPIDQTTLTRRYTRRAVDFIEANAHRPFFLYLPHTFPHIPLHVADDRRGRSAGGLYGDVVEELDWSTGEILAALERTGVGDCTLVVVSSDNGPWFQGSSGRTRGRKHEILEGGMRVPLLARWPDAVSAGAEDADLACGVDLFPTVLDAAGLPLPSDRVVDGESLLPRLRGAPAAEHGPVWFHQIRELRAVRHGRFKYHDRHRMPYGNPPDFKIGFYVHKGPWLFDLATDPDESYDISGSRPEIADELGRLLIERRRALDANPGGWR
jgi:arylsulfatase A-like enzyme